MDELTTGLGEGLNWGFDSPTYNPVTQQYEHRGLVYVGAPQLALGPGDDLGRAAAAAYYFGQLSAWGTGVATMNRQRPLKETLKNISAENNPIPIVYGQAQVGGSIFALGYANREWTVGYIVALGEIESIDSILINGAAPVAGVLTHSHLGASTQTADTYLQSAIAGYADTMVITTPTVDIGIAYIVIKYSDKHYDDWPAVRVNIKGMKVWNPTTATTVYSTNPALHLADLLSNTLYGDGYNIDDASLILAQNYCDDTTPTEVRRTSYQVINSVLDTSEWTEILRAYAGCFVSMRGDTAYFVPDKAAASVMTIGMDNIVEGSISIKKNDSGDIPTVVRCTYTDTSGAEWVERLCTPAKAAGVDLGTTPWRETRFSMVGVNRHSQAYRECLERLNKATVSDLAVEWMMFDEGMQLEVGDVVTLSHDYGLTSKTLRVAAPPTQVSPGRWKIVANEYSATAYSDAVVTDVAYADSVVPSGVVPGAVGSVVATEALYQLLNGYWASRLDIVWAAPSDSFVTGYNVTVSVTIGGAIVWSGNTTNLYASTGTLQEYIGYTVTVTAYNSIYAGPSATATQTLYGKNTVPAAPTGLGGSNNNGDVRLNWTASTDEDVFLYEIRMYTTAQVWADGAILDRTGTLTFSTLAATPGSTWRFGVKSLDSVNQYSTTAAEIDIAVSLSTTGVTTFYAAPTPTAVAAGDLWFNTSSSNSLYYATAAGTGNWVLAQDSAAAQADATQALADAATAQAAADSAQSTADGKVDTWFTGTTPVSTAEGDLWVDTSDSNKIKIYKTGTGWIPLESETISTAAAAAATAQSTADGKITTYYQTSSPAGGLVGDLWIDTTASANTLKYCTAEGPAVWASVQDGAIATAQATADGKNTVYRADGPTGPTGADEGDLWFDTADNNVPYRYTSSVWVSVQDNTGLQVLESSPQTISFTAVRGFRYPCNTTAATFTMTLPLTPSVGDTVGFFDYAKTFRAKKLIVGKNGSNIMGYAQDMDVTVQNASITLQYVDTPQGWMIV